MCMENVRRRSETDQRAVLTRSKLSRQRASAPEDSPVTMDSPDVLAVATAHFRTCVQAADRLQQAFRHSRFYSVLSSTTQPAHVVSFLAVTLVGVLLFPSERHPADPPASTWTTLMYLVAFAAHFGSQFWMTFVSGLSLFFSLPRHNFAEVQKVLFPLYFAINSFLSLLTLGAFLRVRQPEPWDLHASLQVATMSFCFLLELLVRLYLTPPLLTLITIKTDIEKSVEGVGQEIGTHEVGPLAHCPHYLQVHAAFRRVHTTIALANIAAMTCSAFHAHYLSSKICL